MIILLVRFLVAIGQDLWKLEWLYYFGIFALIIFLISLCDELNDRFKRIPFGPMRVPLLGNHFQMLWKGGKRPYKAITILSRTYKDGFMKIFFGLTGYVSVNGQERIMEVISEEEWACERDETWKLDRIETEKKSNSSMTIWICRRNIAIRCLREHIFSRKDALNLLVKKQVEDLLQGIESQEKVDRNSVRVITSDVFLPYVLSTVWSVLTGEPGVNVTDRRIQTLHRCLRDWESKSIAFSGYSDYFPFLVKWFPGWTGQQKLVETNENFRRVLKSLIKEQYSKAEAAKHNPESFVQACIREFKELRKQSFGGDQMNDSSSVALLFEFLCPGPLILSSQVGFALSFAARDPQAQNRIMEEIKSVCGVNEIPTSDKMDRMPFTTAFILETARISSIVPLERRKLIKLVRQGDTRFPRAMPLLLNYHSANFDSTVWENPEVFDPERFLSSTGKLINEDKLISLAAEKHLCAGQPLLKIIMFSFLTGALQKFKFELSPNWVDKGPEFGIINRPQPFKAILKPRYR